MNEGYLSYMLLLVTIILLASGWQRSLAKDIPLRQLSLFLAVWMTGLFFTVPVSQGIYVQASFVAHLLVLFSWLRNSRFASICYTTAASVLSGLISHMLLVLYRLDPILLIFDSRIDRALIIGLFAWTISRRLLVQAAVITIASLLGEVTVQLADASRVPLLICGPEFQDQWWIALYTAMILTLASESLLRLAAAISKKLPRWTRVPRE